MIIQQKENKLHESTSSKVNKGNESQDTYLANYIKILLKHSIALIMRF